MKKVPDWARAARQDIEILEATLKYWREDVKDSISYTDEEKMIFALMDCIGRMKVAEHLNGSK